MNDALLVFLAVSAAATVLMALPHKAYPFEFLLRSKIRKAAIFARDNLRDSDVSDWHWQEYREALVFWYNWLKRQTKDVGAEYHELFVLNSEGEAADVVPPQVLWQRAIHLGLLKPLKTEESLRTGLRAPA